MKRIFFPLLALCFILCSGPLFGGTFFLYIEETCNGERGLFLTRARDGLFDVLFTDGHIIFDDLSDRGQGARLPAKNIALPLSQARQGGADFLIALSIESSVKKISEEPKAPEKIESRCAFFLYEVGTGRLLSKGELTLRNNGREKEFDRTELGLALGREVAVLIEKYF